MTKNNTKDYFDNLARALTPIELAEVQANDPQSNTISSPQHIYVYIGEFTIHAEQGSGHWLQFHDNRGLHGDKKQFWNWNFTLNFNIKSYYNRVRVFDNNDNIIFDGELIGSRKNTNHHMCIPIGLDFNTILSWEGLRAIVETSEIIDAWKKPEEK